MTDDKRSNRIETVIIDRRYNGPIDSGNGGWMAGSLARLFGDVSVSVALRAPVPLAVPMCIRWRDDGTATLDHNGTVVAEATVAPLELDVPIAPNPEEADAAGVLAGPDLRDWISKHGGEPMNMTQPEFARFVQSESQDAARFIKAGVKP